MFEKRHEDFLAQKKYQFYFLKKCVETYHRGRVRERGIFQLVVYIESWVFFWDGIPVGGGEEISDLFFKKKSFTCAASVTLPQSSEDLFNNC